MKPLTNLRLLEAEEPTRQQIALAAIEQNQREWSKQGWHPITTTDDVPLPVDEIQRRSYKVIVVDGRVPWWRRLWRWWKGVE